MPTHDEVMSFAGELSDILGYTLKTTSPSAGSPSYPGGARRKRSSYEAIQ